MRSVRILFILLFCYFIQTSHVVAFDSEKMHPKINENASIQSTANIYFQYSLNLSEGIYTPLNGKRAVDWIREGGTKEDEGIRWFNHFHDPLKPYENAGLWGIPNSSLVWAQNSEKNDASWTTARQLFYEALTTGSEETYANLFLTIGQLTHLVSDKAVPAHVRNDPHPETQLYKIWKISHFEVWAKDHYADTEIMDYAHGIKPNVTIFNNYPSTALTPSPIARLWDTNKYLGNNPEITLTNNIGLAEFTNANFFSEDTVFSTEYSHPHYDDLLRTQTQIPDPFNPAKTVERAYWIKQAAGDLPSYRASGDGYNRYYLEELYIDGSKDFEAFPPLDKYVFQDYAGILVPRAVGYSSALIDYFFRGTLEITPPTEYVYSILDGSNSPQQFTGLKAKVRNTSTISAGAGTTIPEEAGEGELRAIAKYRIMPDYAEDLSSYPQSVAEMDATMRDVPYSYSVSAPVSITSLNPLKTDTATEYLFDFSEQPIPAGITDLYLQVVFRGTLGSEQNATVAVGMKDLNEPQHLTFWNDTDYFLLNGNPVKAETIENNSLVGLYGYIWPYSYNETLAFSQAYPNSAPTPIVELTDHPPARYARLILLTDAADTEYHVTHHLYAQRPPPPVGNAPTTFDGTWKFALPAATTQQDANGNWLMSPTPAVRETRQHYRLYYMNYYPSLGYIDSLPAPPENALGPFPVTIHFPLQTP